MCFHPGVSASIAIHCATSHTGTWAVVDVPFDHHNSFPPKPTTPFSWPWTLVYDVNLRTSVDLLSAASECLCVYTVYLQSYSHVLCPKGHKLAYCRPAFPNTNSEWACGIAIEGGVCMRGMTEEAVYETVPRYGCGQCNYFMCDKCYKQRKPAGNTQVAFSFDDRYAMHTYRHTYIERYVTYIRTEICHGGWPHTRMNVFMSMSSSYLSESVIIHIYIYTYILVCMYTYIDTDTHIHAYGVLHCSHNDCRFLSWKTKP